MVAAGFAACLCLCAWLLWPREPVYYKHPLGYWVVTLAGDVGSDQNIARKALKQAGPAAVPTLLRMLRAHDPAWQATLFKLIQKQHLVKISHTDPDRSAIGAAEGFRVIGSSGKSAVPQVLKIFDANLSPTSHEAAAIALGSIGPDAEAAVPSLLREASSHNSCSLAAISALGAIHADAHEVVPVLVTNAENPSSGYATRLRSIEALAEFGREAREAVPVLEELVRKEQKNAPPNWQNAWLFGPPTLAKKAMDALQKIDSAEYDRLQQEFHFPHILD